jgi:hypothetical protein
MKGSDSFSNKPQVASATRSISRYKTKLALLLCSMGLGMLLTLLVAVMPSPTYAYSTNFDTFASGTLAENLNIPGLTFTATPAGTWQVAPAFFTTLTGQMLYQPTTLGTLRISFAAPQNAVTFNFALSGPGSVLTIQGYSGGNLIFTNNFNGAVQLSGFVEGIASVNSTSIDAIVISAANTLIAMDNLVTTPVPPTPTPTLTPNPTLTPAPTPTPVPAQQPPADLIVQLRQTPDRIAANNPENLVSYSFKVKNVGAGTASSLVLVLPIDPALEVGFATFDNPKAWVTTITTTSVNISLPDLANQQVVSGTIVFRPKASPKAGIKVSTRVTVKYDDPSGTGKSRISNGVTFSFGEPGSNQDVAGGNIQLMEPDNTTVKAGDKVVYLASFFVPDETVTFWLTKPDNSSLSLGTINSGETGAISITLDTTGLAPGSYVVAAYGNRSEITGSGILIVQSTAAPSSNNPTTIQTVNPWKR